MVLVCVVSVSAVCAQSSPAEGVLFDQWAYEAVQKLVDDAPFGMVYPSRVTAPDRPFPDVPVDHWAFDAVEKLRKAGIIIGYPSGTFSWAELKPGPSWDARWSQTAAYCRAGRTPSANRRAK